MAFANASGMLTCRVIADALNIAFFVVVSRLLGPEGVGAYSYGFALAAFVFAAASLGVEQYGVREYQHASTEARSRILSDLLTLQLGVALLAFAALALYLFITNASFSTAVIACELSAYQLFSAIATTLFVPALAEQRMLRPSIMALLTRSIAFIAASLMLLTGRGSLEIALIAFPLMSLVYVVIAIASVRAHKLRIRLRWSVGPMRKAATAMRLFAIAELLGQLLAKAGVIVLVLVVNERAAGVFATGLKFVEIGFLPLWFLGVAMYPRLCRAHMETASEFRKLARTLLFAAFGMTLLVVFAFVVLVPPLLVPLLGHGYEGTQSIIKAMALVALWYGMEIAFGRVLYARGQQRSRASALAFGAVVCVVFSMVGAQVINTEGVIAATALAYFAIDVWYGVATVRTPQSTDLAGKDANADPADVMRAS